MRLLAVAITIGLVGFAAATAARSGADAPELVGVDKAVLEERGIHLGQPSGRTPRVTPAKAIEVAAGEGSVRETVLASLEAPNTRGGQKRDVWVVNFDPATVEPSSHGPPPELGRPPGEQRVEIALTFIDAQTGEYVFAVTQGVYE
jgi:hypothetical protein